MQGFKLSLVLSLILCIDFSTLAQEIPVNKYGVAVIKEPVTYIGTVRADSSKKMVELTSMVPGLVYDLRYATRNNFMKTRMYPANTRHTFMRLPAAKALAQVQSRMNAQGYGLKVWDAYRPYSVTERFWEMIRDERYVANPAKASGHNRGLAIDLTIIELSTGKELDMGTGFDNFTDTAHHNFTKLSTQVLQNRKLLKDAMESSGFIAFESEWWHYSFPNTRNYEPLDIPFKRLRKLQVR
ncbi:MAG TPA: M15 family metallopeptidase [Chitinophagaceae bacterium]|nr:M15 family metallopeptidase [Chitinophagaceae bacterium]